MRFRLSLFLVAAVATSALAGSGPGPEALYSESFETSMGGWVPRHYLACEQTLPPCWPLDWHIERSTQQAHDGEYGLEYYLNGDHDDGTIWVERCFDTSNTTIVGVVLRFYLWSEEESQLNQWPVVAYAGPVRPQREEDFLIVGLTEEVAGWKEYQLMARANPDRPLFLAFGITATWEIARTYYLDDVHVQFLNLNGEPQVQGESQSC